MVAYDGSELDDVRDGYEDDERDEVREHNAHQIASLRAFLDALEAADLVLPYPLTNLSLQAGFDHTGADNVGRIGLARLLRAARRAGLSITKGEPPDPSAQSQTRSYYLTRPDGERFGYIYAPAALTCERVQTGVRFEEKPVFAPAVQVGTERVEVPVYEWRCEPVLAPAADPVADAEDRGSRSDPDRFDDQ